MSIFTTTILWYVNDFWDSELQTINKIEIKKPHSCEGIKYYYNKDFLHDLYDMKMDYIDCYDSSETKFTVDTILPPAFIKHCIVKGMDCEDFQSSVLCLADLYDVECKRTTTKIFRERNNEIAYHAGVECKIDNEWLEVA